jgi:hypothetical protein
VNRFACDKLKTPRKQCEMQITAYRKGL